MLGLGLNQLEEILLTLQAPSLNINPALCSRLRHKNSKCALCSDKCPTHAIEWTDSDDYLNSLKICPDKCNSCGICANVCPNGVFEALKPSDEDILVDIKRLLDMQKEIVFECTMLKGANTQDDQSSSIKVPCLARLNEAVLIGAFALGAKSVWLINGSCQGCEYESSLAIAENTVKNAQEILRLLGFPEVILFSKNKLKTESAGEKAEKAAGPSRREFFKSMVKETQKTGALLATNIIDSYKKQYAEKPKKQHTELPTLLPSKRGLLLSCMKRLGNLTEEASEARSPLFCHFKINKKCSGCQMCAFFCPTGALTKFNEEGKTGVRFKMSDCTACGLCQEICYREAIQLSNCVDLHKVLDKYTEEITMREGPFVHPWQ